MTTQTQRNTLAALLYDVLVTDSNTVKEFWLKGVFQVEDAR